MENIRFLLKGFIINLYIRDYLSCIRGCEYFAGLKLNEGISICSVYRKLNVHMYRFVFEIKLVLILGRVDIF